MIGLPRRAVLEPIETELLDALGGLVGVGAAEELWSRVCLLRGLARPVVDADALRTATADVAAVLADRVLAELGAR